MGKKQKYYVVWKGVSPGVYTSWTDCQLQVKGFDGALYKSFDTQEEAEHAFASPAHHYVGNQNSKPKTQNSVKSLPENFDMNCVAVDAACSGNPGPMEYRGVYLLTGQEIFHFGPVHGTNNIGEFLAIVHALALMEKQGVTDRIIYSDSVNAQLWVSKRKCKTKLERTERTETLFQIVERAEKWLSTHDFRVPIVKWDTKKWGEIPADFGRK